MDFLNREELLSFRTASTLLGYLDIIEQRGEVEKGKIMQPESYQKSGRKSEVFLHSKISHLANVLIRSNEVIPAGEAADGVEIISKK